MLIYLSTPAVQICRFGPNVGIRDISHLAVNVLTKWSIFADELTATTCNGTDLRRWHDGEGVHDSVGILLANLADEQGAHSRASATTERMRELESL